MTTTSPPTRHMPAEWFTAFNDQQNQPGKCNRFVSTGRRATPDEPGRRSGCLLPAGFRDTLARLGHELLINGDQFHRLLSRRPGDGAQVLCCPPGGGLTVLRGREGVKPLHGAFLWHAGGQRVSQ